MSTTPARPRLRLVHPGTAGSYLQVVSAGLRHRQVTVLTTYADRWFSSTVLAGIERVVQDAGHEVVVHEVGRHWDLHPVLRSSSARSGLGAVVSIALPIPPDLVRSWEAVGVPVVVAGARVEGAESVHVDDVRAGRLATEHLTRLGHRRIALVRTCDEVGQTWSADYDRARGYDQALAMAGIRPADELVVTVPFGPRGGAVAAERLMALPEPPTAIFASCDETAFGCLSALTARGYAVPGEVSVVGVDDHPLAETLGLSTVDQRVELQGELAGRLVLDALHGIRRPATHDAHEVELTFRGRSTSAPRRPTPAEDRAPLA